MYELHENPIGQAAQRGRQQVLAQLPLLEAPVPDEVTEPERGPPKTWAKGRGDRQLVEVGPRVPLRDVHPFSRDRLNLGEEGGRSEVRWPGRTPCRRGDSRAVPHLSLSAAAFATTKVRAVAHANDERTTLPHPKSRRMIRE